MSTPRGAAFRQDFIVQTDSRLNKVTLDTINANRGEYTDADLVQLLGPADSIVIGSDQQRPGTTLMLWEEVSRIELTYRDGKLEKMSGKFSPHHHSKFINYPGFKKLKTGMSQYDVHQHCCRGVDDSHENPDTGATTLIYEAYNRFRIKLREGKVRSASRLTYRIDSGQDRIERDPR